MGDLFAQLWDEWALRIDPSSLDVWSQEHAARVRSYADACLMTGEIPTEVFNPDSDESAFVGLKILDEVLASCHTGFHLEAGAMRRIAARAAAIGRFDSGALGGAVVPKWTSPGRPGETVDRTLDAFRAAVRIPSQDWNNLHWCAPGLGDLHASVGTDAEPLRLAFAPMLDELTDIAIEHGTGVPPGTAGRWYRLRPRTDRVLPRLRPLLDELEKSLAHIAVLPEGALDSEILQAWQDLLRTTPRRADSRLTWVIAGSGPTDDSLSSTSVILDRDGNVLLETQKLTRFTFGEGVPAAWGLSTALGGDATPIHENIRIGRTVAVLASGVGRFVVLICEDLARHSDPRLQAAVAAQPTHALVPVFSGPFHADSWAMIEAYQYAMLDGISVAVGNSRVVAHAMKLANVQCRAEIDLAHPQHCLYTMPPDDDSWNTRSWIGGDPGTLTILPPESINVADVIEVEVDLDLNALERAAADPERRFGSDRRSARNRRTTRRIVAEERRQRSDRRQGGDRRGDRS